MLQAKTSLNPNFKRFDVEFSSPNYDYGTPLPGSSFYYEVNVLYVHMMALRKKLITGHTPKIVRTGIVLRGIGT